MIDANFKRLVIIDEHFKLLRINTHSTILLVSMLAMDISERLHNSYLLNWSNIELPVVGAGAGAGAA
jgi:hypothetical protein